MKKYLLLMIFIFGLPLLITTAGWAENKTDQIWLAIGDRLAADAQDLLQTDFASMLVLSNASYVMNDGESPAMLLDALAKKTGTSVGKRTLLELHSARNSPLWAVIYDRRSGQAVYCTVNQQKVRALIKKQKFDLKGLKSGEIFSKMSKQQIDFAYLQTNAATWDKKIGAKIFDGNEFRILSIINGVDHGAPADLIKSMLYHDHFCPGVTSGYLIANYLAQEFPLRSAAESYTILSIPVWCKEDALQTVLNTTPGKSSLAVLTLDKEAVQKRLLPEAKNLAGIYFRTNSQNGKSEAVVLSCDVSQLQRFTPPISSYGWLEKITTVLATLDHLPEAVDCVQVLKRWELPPNERPEMYTTLGINVLEKTGLVKPAE